MILPKSQLLRCCCLLCSQPPHMLNVHSENRMRMSLMIKTKFQTLHPSTNQNAGKRHYNDQNFLEASRKVKILLCEITVPKVTKKKICGNVLQHRLQQPNLSPRAIACANDHRYCYFQLEKYGRQKMKCQHTCQVSLILTETPLF